MAQWSKRTARVEARGVTARHSTTAHLAGLLAGRKAYPGATALPVAIDRFQRDTSDPSVIVFSGIKRCQLPHFTRFFQKAKIAWGRVGQGDVDEQTEGVPRPAVHCREGVPGQRIALPQSSRDDMFSPTSLSRHFTILIYSPWSSDIRFGQLPARGRTS